MIQEGLIDSQLREDLQPTQSGSLSSLTGLSILSHPQHHHQEHCVSGSLVTFHVYFVQNHEQGQHCGSYLSWLWILSELAVDQPPRINTGSCLSWLQILSWLAVDPPGSTLCRSSQSWLWILPVLGLLINPPGSTINIVQTDVHCGYIMMHYG